MRSSLINKLDRAFPAIIPATFGKREKLFFKPEFAIKTQETQNEKIDYRFAERRKRVKKA
jgi:hypothetical protein